MNAEKIMIKLHLLLQGSLKILVIEENLSRQFSMTKTLKRIYPGATVHCIQKLEQSQMILKNQAGEYDFVVSDTKIALFFSKPLKLDKMKSIQIAFQQFMQQFYAGRTAESDTLNLGLPECFSRNDRVSSAA